MDVDLFVRITLLVNGLYLVIFALVNHTKDIRSSIVYKVIPFFLGCACLLAAYHLWGWF